MAEYNNLITKEVLLIEIEDRRDITQEEVKNINGTINELEDIECDLEWLSDTTEKWCRDRAIYLALMESIKIADGQDDKQNRDAIPTILSDALSVSFNRNVGHDYLETMRKDTNYTTGKRVGYNSTSNILIRLQKEASQTRRSISHLQALGLVNLCLCVIMLVLFS